MVGGNLQLICFVGRLSHNMLQRRKRKKMIVIDDNPEII